MISYRSYFGESCFEYRAETKMMGLRHRIWQMKISLLKRIKKQGAHSLSGQILQEQRDKNWPGLAREVSEICEELSIPDINIHDIPDSQIKKAVYNHHYNKMIDDITNSKKSTKMKIFTIYNLT